LSVLADAPESVRAADRFEGIPFCGRIEIDGSDGAVLIRVNDERDDPNCEKEKDEGTESGSVHTDPLMPSVGKGKKLASGWHHAARNNPTTTLVISVGIH
jgi:hypothetical protein